jgi:hypothetical protein
MESKKIKIKYYFGFSMLVLHALKEVLNKISKYLLFQKYYSYISLKKAKTNKVGLTKK